MSELEVDPAQALEAREIARNRAINETIKCGDSPVQRFYAGAVVLVTGASGFLGKGLIEKLFRSCDIRKIYVLLRAREGKSVQTRVKDITDDMLFDYLRESQPDFVKKIVPVTGDISKIKLGVNDSTWKTLSQEVNVIFHVAATINFVEPLKKAVLTNLRGTREIIHLARDCRHLKSLVHVSTAFAHAVPERVNQVVLEKFYDVPISPDFLIQLVEDFDERRIDAMTPALMDGWPNTYSFTKAGAEELLRRAGDLPVCVVRPSIVMPAYREPPGWVDKSTMNGPVGFIIGACLGGLHVMFAKSDNILDMVPVDLVNNATIVAGYDTVARRERGDSEVKIYAVTNMRNPSEIHTLHSFLESNKGRSLQTPKMFWHGYVIMTTNPVVFILITWLLHFIPGYLVDVVLKVSGKKPKAVRLFDRAYKQNKIYGYYMTKSWKFDDSNLYGMFLRLSADDRIIYNFDVESIEIDRYMPICCIGARKYIIRDGLQNTNYAVKKGHIFRIINYIYLTAYAWLLWKLATAVLGFLQIIFR